MDLQQPQPGAKTQTDQLSRLEDGWVWENCGGGREEAHQGCWRAKMDDWEIDTGQCNSFSFLLCTLKTLAVEWETVFSGQTFTCNYEEIWRTSGFISVGKMTESWCQNNTKVIICVVKKAVRSKHEMKHSKEDSVVLSGTFLMSYYQYVLQ